MLSQLVVRLADHSLHLEPRNAGDDPVAFDRPESGQIVPRLGSRDLIRLAGFAVDHGYLLDAVIVRDRTMSPLPSELEDEVSDRLVETLRSGAPLANDALSGDRGPYTVVEIELTTSDMETIRVGRLGTVESFSDDATSGLMEPAWTQLHLS
jgi:hypothetical protein